MSLLLEATVKISFVLLTAVTAMPLLRRQPAALRHLVLTMSLLSAAIAPFADRALPAWRLAVPLTDATVAPAATIRAADAAVRGNGQESAALQLAAAHRVDGGVVIVGIWLVGALVFVLVLTSGLFRLRRLASAATRVTTGKPTALAEAIRADLGLRRPVLLLETSAPRLLVAWGVTQPKVLLPTVARDWSAERIRLVLYHELAHVRRGDWLVQCAAELLRAAQWFNPLVWTVCARLRQESEQACDDVVINRGAAGSDYAAHLVAIARDFRRQSPWIPAPAIAPTSGFERRVQAMLDVQQNRRPVSRSMFIATLLANLAITLPIAALAAAQGALATFTGSVVDPLNGVLPDAAVTLTNVATKAKYEVRTNREGRYEIPGVPPGQYMLETRLPGFSSLRLELTVAGSNVERDLRLDLGSLQETISVRPGTPQIDPAKEAANRARVDAFLRKRAADTTCPATPATPATSGPLIGGNIRQPVKLRDVRPVYPAEFENAGTGGTVVLEAWIGTNGAVRDINVISAPDPAFAGAAADAVRQWEFDPTLLNCVAVEVKMTVTVTFLQPGL